MTTLEDLQERVSTRFDALGLPAWPDPNPERTSPSEERYSRVTEPERYDVVHARARVWTDVLVEVLGARVEALSPLPRADPGRRGGFGRGVRLVPRNAEALSLLLLERDAPVTDADPPTTLAVLEIGVERPDLLLDTQPDCGCDACDSGSADLLEAVDQTVRRVVGGPLVVLRGDGWEADWSPDGGSTGSDGGGPTWDTVMAWCRRLAAGDTVDLPSGTEALVGRSWLEIARS